MNEMPAYSALTEKKMRIQFPHAGRELLEARGSATDVPNRAGLRELVRCMGQPESNFVSKTDAKIIKHIYDEKRQNIKRPPGEVDGPRGSTREGDAPAAP